MDMKAKLLVAMALFFTPIVIDLVIATLRGARRYRLNDLLANMNLSLLTVVGSALAAGLTLWVYDTVYQTYAVLELSAAAAGTWIAAFLAYDFFYYWAHRTHHTIALLWGVHVVHHSGEDMNFGLAVRQSALGALTSWVFFLPMAVAGIPSEIYLAIAGIQLLYQYFIHNTYVPALGWLEYALVTPSQHRVHHARNELYIDKNYGNILVIWDRLFGTYQAEVPEHPVVYGLRHSVGTWNPMTLHTHAFVETARKAAACTRGLDKLRCFLKGPGWQPPSLDPARFAGDPDDGPSARFVKYDPAVSRSRGIYCTAQFLALTGFVVLVMSNMEAMTTATATGAVGLIVVSAWSLGGLLDSQPVFWRLELARLATIALAGVAFALARQDGAHPVQAALPFLGFAAASALYLFRFRPGFLASEPAVEARRDAVAG